MDNFFTWLNEAPPVTEKAQDAPAPAPVAPAQAQAPAQAPVLTYNHMALGKDMAKAIPGAELTKDLYGKGPEQHGSAYKISGNQVQAVSAFVTRKGFRPAGQNIWKMGTFRIDVGTDAANTYVYITDNESK